MFPESFHPEIKAWFLQSYGKPTDIQEAAWPLIEEGKHVLVLAPTGSGKTLTSFLAAVSRLATGTYAADRLSVLYVSPLKALNEDIRRNLLAPVAAIRERFEKKGIAFPDIRVETRSGDTPQSERRRFLLHPPSILALTPESLAILLLNPRGRETLSSVRYLILDEIHTALGSKRGSFLSCQVDRLSLLAGEFQRVALSATVKPAERAAAFAGGYTAAGDGWKQREVSIVESKTTKKISVRVEFPPTPVPEESETRPLPDRYGPRYTLLSDFILNRIEKYVSPNASGPDAGVSASGRTAGNSTVLVFTDSRRRAERIAYLLNEKAGRKISFAHHGSLSREIRRSVEERLAAGEIPCVIATGSLELGIDIGGVAEVILAGSPRAVSTALQRIGRSGHSVGGESRGIIIPFHGMELLFSAALAGAIGERDIEESRSIENPLDLLAQIILALCAEKDRGKDELFNLLRGFGAFHTLSRSSYDTVIAMLSGRYTGDRLRELKNRLWVDAESGTLKAADGTTTLLYSSGGVIPNRGTYALRTSDGIKLGDVDEEFVWERRIGDTFSFGTRSWSVAAIGSEAIEVVPMDRDSDYAPFWKADTAYQSPVLVGHVLRLLDRFSKILPPRQKAQDKFPFDETGNGEKDRLRQDLLDRGLNEDAVNGLREFLFRQAAVQEGCPLPGLYSLPVEIVDDPVHRSDSIQVILHSFRGGALNYPLSMAISQYLEESLKVKIESVADETSILILFPRSLGENPEVWTRKALNHLASHDRESRIYFRRRFESSGVFGASFREAAERALLIPRPAFGKRLPLWVMRERSRRLFEAVSPFGDFPVTAEAWRTSLQDMFDMRALEDFLGGIGEGKIAVSFFRTRSPSPFARELSWKETNQYMYEYDESPGRRGMSLLDKTIQDATGSGRGLPSLSPNLAADFSARLRRELPLWTPDDIPGLVEWVKERIAIPLDEWETLMKACPGELRLTVEAGGTLGSKIELFRREGAALPSLVHREYRQRWEKNALKLLGPWLRYEGPVSLKRISDVFGVSLDEALGAAKEPGENFVNIDGGGLLCDKDNLELLVRLSRKQSRPEVKARPLALLTPYLALRQKLIGAASSGIPGAETKPWEILSCYAAPVKLFETEFFPARIPAYNGKELDTELKAGKCLWFGGGKERAAFALPEELDMALPLRGMPELALNKINWDRPRGFWEIKEAFGGSSEELTAALWKEAWKGRLSSDSWEAVRRAISAGFTRAKAHAEKENPVPQTEFPPGQGPGRFPRIPTALRDRWKSGPPVSGEWYALGEEDYNPEEDPLIKEEMDRERVRLLLKRWGVLCRPLLERELPPFSWSSLLPVMRRMELAGELVTGRFFEGINSLQFASPSIKEELEAAEENRALYWFCAADPASPSGLEKTGLPPRLAGTRLCFRGAELCLVSYKQGKELGIYIPPGDPDLVRALTPLSSYRKRGILPEKKVTVETINGKSAGKSEYAQALIDLGFINDRGKLTLY